MAAELTAYGAALWRGEPEAPEVAMVHRPAYDDWSLPKGKPHPGEHPWRTAAREVEEETGCLGGLGRRLGSVRYEVDGRGKRVRFWAARLVDEGSFTPGTEVDDLRWLPVPEARALASHEGDAATLDRFVPPYDTTTILLVRHGHAGKPEAWPGEDALRPLDDLGKRQAEAVRDALPAFAPRRVLSAEPVRCIDTVRPLAGALGVTVEIEPAFGEECYWDERQRAIALLRELALGGVPVVVCSQGGAIPDLVATVTGRKDVRARKGSVWALTFAAGEVVDAEYADRLESPEP